MKEENPEEYERRRQRSTNPRIVRDRARYHAKRAEQELALIHKPVEEWDYEELAHGRPRSKDGGFTGRPRAIVPREVHEEAIRRFQQLLQSKIRVVSSPAVDVLMRVMHDDETPPNTQAQIAEYLLDRVLGRPTQHVEGQADITHHIQQMLATSMANPEGEVIEAEIVEDEDDEDDDDIEPETHGHDRPSLIVRRQD